MKESEQIRIDLLLALAEPEYARVDYLKDKQSKSSYSKEVYLKKLVDIQAFYGSKIKNETAKKNRYGNNISNYKLPLFSETNGELTGHLGNAELDELGAAIIELSKDFNLKWDNSFYESVSESAKGALKDILESKVSDESKLRQLKSLRERFKKGLLEPFRQIYEQSKNAKFLVDISQAVIADSLILDEIIKLESTGKKSDKIIDKEPIHWLKGEDTLRQFLNSLKSSGLIEYRETDDIIQEHFKVDGKVPTKKPKPLIWLESLSLLAYMIETLDRSYIKPDNLWKDTMPHFLKNSQTPENMRQTANRYKNNKFGKPKGFEIVDDIFDKLKV